MAGSNPERSFTRRQLAEGILGGVVATAGATVGIDAIVDANSERSAEHARADFMERVFDGISYQGGGPEGLILERIRVEPPVVLFSYPTAERTVNDQVNELFLYDDEIELLYPLLYDQYPGDKWLMTNSPDGVGYIHMASQSLYVGQGARAEHLEHDAYLQLLGMSLVDRSQPDNVSYFKGVAEFSSDARIGKFRTEVGQWGVSRKYGEDSRSK